MLRIRWVKGISGLALGLELYYSVLSYFQEPVLPTNGRHLQAIFDRAPIGMFRSTPAGRFLEVNPATASLLGYASPAEMLEVVNARGIAETLFADPAKRDVFVTEMRGRLDEWYVTEVSYRKKDGGFLDAILSICLQHDPEIDDLAFFGFIQDITERKRQEAQRQRTEKLLALGMLASGVAHDFNNLLAGILGYSDLMATEEDPRQLQSLATRLHKVVDKAQGFTSGLLRFSRHGVQETVSFDAHELVRSALDLFEAVRPATIKVHQALEAAQTTLRGFPDHFQNAVLNLCLNARDAMPEGGHLAIRTRNVTFAPQETGQDRMPEGPCLCLEVQDSGCGMTPEVLAHCLDPFYTTKAEGTGLGLPSVRGTVAAMGGILDIRSTPGEGACFCLFLPLHSVETAKESPCA